MNKKIFTLLHPTKDTNSYNWSFWEDRALVRVEDKTFKSKIVEYKFDYKKKTLTNPKTILEDPYFSLEDPRLISKNSFTYVKYDREKIECHFMKDSQPQTNGHEWQKNWQYINEEKYFYRIKPLIIKGPNYKERVNYNLNWKYGDKLHLSSNMFEINERQFIIFHSFKGATVNTRKYYQGIIELENLKPKFYVPKPFFYPPKKTNPFKFKKNKNKCVFVMCARTIKNELYITAGINDCEAALITIPNEEFINWVDKNKEFVQDISSTNPTNGLREYQNFYRLKNENIFLP